jgi:membrane-associated phospholipid phosphatase
VQAISPVWFGQMMTVISFPGSSPQSFIIVALVIAFLFLVGLRWESVSILFAGAGSSALATVVKLIVRRARPAGNIVQVIRVVQGYSFPSGHGVFYVAFFGFLIFVA